MKKFILIIFILTAKSSFSEVDFETGLSFRYGASSNPAQVPEAIEVASDFIEFTPTVSAVHQLNNKLWGFASLGASFTVYGDETVADNLNRSTYEIASGLSYFYSDVHEFGFEVAHSVIDGWTINPFNPDGFPFKRNAQSFSPYYRFNKDSLNGEVRLKTKSDDAETVIFDEASNSFEDDNSSVIWSFLIEKNITKVFLLRLSYARESVDYEGRTARESNGLADDIPRENPLFKMRSNQFSFNGESRFGFFKLFAGLGRERSTDLIFGAETFDRNSFFLRVKTQLTSKIVFIIEHDQRKTTYENFRALVDINSTDERRRVDDFKSLSFLFEWKLKLADLQIGYQRSRIDSNYRTLSSELAAFDEKLLTVGFKVEI